MRFFQACSNRKRQSPINLKAQVCLIIFPPVVKFFGCFVAHADQFCGKFMNGSGTAFFIKLPSQIPPAKVLQIFESAPRGSAVFSTFLVKFAIGELKYYLFRMCNHMCVLIITNTPQNPENRKFRMAK